jgi:hypothetical protein
MAAREVSFSPAAPDVRAIALVPARTMAEAARAMVAGLPVTVAFGSDPGQRGTGPAGSQPGMAAEQQTGPQVSHSAASEYQPKPADGMISLEAGGRRLTARLIAGEFIRYRARFPDEYGYRAEVPAAPMIEAVRRAALVAERAGPVRLSFGPGEVVIEAHAQGRARAVEKVVAEFDGDQSVISFNPHYLLDGLTAAAASATARPAGGSGGTAVPAGQDAAAESAATGGAIVTSETATSGGPNVTDETATATATGGAAHDREAAEASGWIRLEFTSPAKPALITCVGDEGLETGPDGKAGFPAFRYLLVPLRTPVRTS